MTEVIWNPMFNQKKQKCSCLINPISLLIYSIIVAIFVVAGLYFRISNNEGYLAYKGIIEKEINILDANSPFPNENETLKLMAYFKRDKNEDSFCTYLKYSVYECFEKKIIDNIVILQDIMKKNVIIWIGNISLDTNLFAMKIILKKDYVMKFNIMIIYIL